jgi:hypothetical protein
MSDDLFSTLERAFGASSVSGAGGSSGGGGGGGGGGGALRPFLHPDMAAVFRRLPARSAPAEYLATVAHNVLAEYRLFLAESSYTRFSLRVPTAPALNADPGRVRVSSAQRVREQPADGAPEAALSDAALSELHHHVGVRSGRLVIAVFSSADKSAEGGGRPGLHLIQGAHWTGRRMGRDDEDSDDDFFFDLGYMGDAVNEHAAATALLLGTTRPEPRLLASIADPACRRAATFRSPGAGVGGVVPINELQRSVLDGMRHDVEAVQGALTVSARACVTGVLSDPSRFPLAHAGPPGTGKSTLVYHVRCVTAGHALPRAAR